MSHVQHGRVWLRHNLLRITVESSWWQLASFSYVNRRIERRQHNLVGTIILLWLPPNLRLGCTLGEVGLWSKTELSGNQPHSVLPANWTKSAHTITNCSEVDNYGCNRCHVLWSKSTAFLLFTATWSSESTHPLQVGWVVQPTKPVPHPLAFTWANQIRDTSSSHSCKVLVNGRYNTDYWGRELSHLT